MHPQINIDTSYSIFSAFQKHVKKYPNIKIAKVPINEKIDKKENLVYCRYGLREMHLDLFSPTKKHKKPQPCVILVHGGGWISGDKSLLHPIANAIAEKGMTAVSIEYRLSNEAKYPAAIIDAYKAIGWVCQNAENLNIDTNKISILGTSAGAQLASLAGTTYHQPLYIDSLNNWNKNIRIHSIINIDGVLAFLHPLSKEGAKPNSAAEKWFGVHYSQDSIKWIEASALSYIDKKAPPTLFIASKHPRFHAGRKEMTTILNQHHIYNEKRIHKDAPHSFWLFYPWYKPTIKWVLNFLKKINK